MIAAGRQQKILDALTTHEFMTFQVLAENLQVSVMTVRRDVAELSSQGKLIAVRGGVKSLSAAHDQGTGPLRHPALLRAALNQVGESRIIFMDGGELSRELAQFIPWREDMTAVTNDFRLASDIIAHTPAELFFIGGELKRSDNTFHQRLALNTLKTLNFELVFLTPDSWNERGAWHHEEHRQIWYQTLISVSARTVLLAQAQGYGRSGLFHLYPLQKADVVLTDHADSACLMSGLITSSKLRLLR